MLKNSNAFLLSNNGVTPFVKWAGGKRQIISNLKSLLPESDQIENYIEPFIGAGALLFETQPSKAIINDLNSELVNTYIVIKQYPEELIVDLKKHKNLHVLNSIDELIELVNR